MNHFSRDKRFSDKVTFSNFQENLNQVLECIHSCGIDAKVEILTAEDLETYNFSTVTFDSDEVTEKLKARKAYSFFTFDDVAWQKAYIVSTMIRAKDDTSYFMWIECDRYQRAYSLRFSLDSQDESFTTTFMKQCARPSFFWSIGDGRPKSSRFNYEYGRCLTGIDQKQ